jgi:hypothetical protein
MCLRILHNILHLEKFNLHWDPHFLNNNQKIERVTLSHGLLEVLEKDEGNNICKILTGNESRFSLEYPHESVQTASWNEIW